MISKSIGKRRMGKDEKIFKAVGYTLLFIFAVVCLIPFLIVIGSSFTSESSIIKYGYSIIPKEFSLDSYKTIFENPMTIIRSYGVTIVVTIVETTLSVFLNTMTGYVLQRKDFEWRNKFSFYFFFTTLFRRSDAMVYFMRSVSSSERQHSGHDSSRRCLCMEYSACERLYVQCTF